MKFYLLAITAIFFLFGCDVVNPYGDDNSESTTQPSSSCIAGVPLPLGFEQKKKENIPKLYFSKGTLEKKSLKAGIKMTAIFDISCLQRKGSFVESDKRLLFSPGAIYKIDPDKVSFKTYATTVVAKSAYSLKSFRQKAERDSCLKFLRKEYELKKFAVPNDARYSDAAHLDFLNAPDAWDIFYHATTGILSETVVIAVIDSGGDYDHPDLIDNVWTNPDETVNGSDDDGNGIVDDQFGANIVDSLADPSPLTPPQGDNDHGTNVAGAAAARMNNSIGAAGIMGLNSEIMHLNIAGAGGLSTTGLVNALNYAQDKSADIINLSLGYDSPDLDDFDFMSDMMQDIVNDGTVIVAAAGNDGEEQTSTTFSYPGTPLGAQIQGFINVGSLDVETDQISSFSNFSDVFVEIMAPGSENSSTATGIFMPDPGSDPANSYDDASGTSFASPIVAGAVGLIIGLLRTRGETPTPAQVEQALKDNAVQSGSFSGRVENCNTLDLNALANGL